jgi:hypothetical protein
VGGEPTAAVDADAGTGASADAIVEVDRWSQSDTPFGTSEEHYQMKQTYPSSSLFPCGRGLHRPQS